MPPARLLITAVLTASSKSLAPEAPPLLISAGAACEAVDDLVAAKVDGVIAVELGVDAFVEFAVTGIAHVEGLVAAVIFRELLLDDVGLDGDAEMVGLTGQVRRRRGSPCLS